MIDGPLGISDTEWAVDVPMLPNPSTWTRPGRGGVGWDRGEEEAMVMIERMVCSYASLTYS